MGRYTNPPICDEDNLLNASRVLTKTSLKFQSFEKINPNKGDLVYCDPPYDKTFTFYTNKGFNSQYQESLKIACDKWIENGAYVIVSNSNTFFIKKLYKEYTFVKVKAPRNINCKSENRSKISEFIILSY